MVIITLTKPLMDPLYLQSPGLEVALGRRRTPAFAAWSWQYFDPAKGGHQETWTAPVCYHKLQKERPQQCERVV